MFYVQLDTNLDHFGNVLLSQFLGLKPNSITLASSELAPNMFGASSELVRSWFAAGSKLNLAYHLAC